MPIRYTCPNCNQKAFRASNIKHKPDCPEITRGAYQRAVDGVLAAAADLQPAEQARALGAAATLFGLCARINVKGECGCHVLAPAPQERRSSHDDLLKFRVIHP
jgi:hypothetical protein